MTDLTILDVHSLHEFIDFLAHANSGFGALVLVFTSAAAWAMKSYVSMMLWQFHRRQKITELCTVIMMDASNSIKSYSRNFDHDSKLRTLATLEEMRTKRKYRSFVIASNNSSFLTDGMRDQLGLLPAAISGLLAAYKNAESEFDASYQALGSENLPKSGYDGIKLTIEEVYGDCNTTIENGTVLVDALINEIAANKNKNLALGVLHIVMAIISAGLLWNAITSWPI